MSYIQFAKVYDLLMKDIPYGQWIKYLEKIFKKYNFTPKIMLELGCGTGNITTQLAKKNYEVIGIDNSIHMLMIAKDKAEREKLDILYLQQDMKEFELYGSVNCVISLCDSLNYITQEDDLRLVFKNVYHYLDSEGLFVFDMNTAYKFSNIMGNQSFSEVYEDVAYIWDNYYDDEEEINEYALTLFMKEEDNNYKRYDEFHYEKAYSIHNIKELLEEAGLKVEAVYDEGTFNPPNETSERIYYVARKKT